MYTPLSPRQFRSLEPVHIVDNSIDGLKRAIVEDDFAVLTLFDDGVIRDCNMACTKLLCCDSNNLIWQHISMFLPQLGDVELVDGERINPTLRFLSRIGHHFEVIASDGNRFLSAVFFNDVQDFGRHCLRIILKPVSQPLFN
jgi:hypothetical protein